MFFRNEYGITKSAGWLYAFFASLLIGIFFSTLIPPFQSPDEPDHLKRAYFLSKGRIAMESPSGHSTGGLIDTGLINYMGQFQYIAGNQQKKITGDIKKKSEKITWAGEEQFSPCPGVNYYFPLIYLPQASGLAVGQILDLTVSQSYYLARYAAFICSLIVIFIAFWIFRPSLFIAALLAMPLTIFQLVSTSQDGFATALVVLAGSLFLRITNFKDRSNSALFVLMCVVILLLVTSRVNLAPMLLLPFVASYLSFKHIKYYGLSLCVFFLSLLWIFYAITTTVDLRIEKGASTAQISLFYLQNPLAFISVLQTTILNPQTVQFYIGSFIAVLGWLDTALEKNYILAIFWCLVFLFFTSISFKELKEQKLQRLSMALVSVVSIFLVFFLMLVTWTNHPAEKIEGVQGRYFWGPIILLGLALTTSSESFSLIRKKLILTALLCLIGISLFATPNTLLTRYFLQAKQPKDSAPIELIDRDIVIGFEFDSATEKGGFIDSSDYSDGEIVLVGWGYFDKDEKLFLSNKEEKISARYITVERPDVADALDEEAFIYSGFELRIPAETFEEAQNIMHDLCLYSQTPTFGARQLIAGSANKLYKCLK